MTMRTRYPLKCVCGQGGALKMTENDQPYSKMYEEYSLEGFDGGTYSVDGYTDLQTAITAMKPVCPRCGAKIEIENVVKSI